MVIKKVVCVYVCVFTVFIYMEIDNVDMVTCVHMSKGICQYVDLSVLSSFMVKSKQYVYPALTPLKFDFTGIT